MKYDMPARVNADTAGFRALAELRNRGMSRKDEEVEVNMEHTRWFNAQMCAPLGAILYELEEASNPVRIVNIESKVETVLSKNKFLSYYGGNLAFDEDSQIIPYERFRMKQDDSFYKYVRQIVEMSGMSEQPDTLRKRFQQGMSEVFSNVTLHARSELGIFVCANFSTSRLFFAVSDLGVGICQKINEGTGQNLTTKEAIEWAVKVGNTTKDIPGGLGLNFLIELIDSNGGRLKIVSDNCYWQRERGENSVSHLDGKLSGTTVVVEINTPPVESTFRPSQGIMRYNMPAEVSADKLGFNALAKLRANALESNEEEIEVNMAQTWWFSAQMCAPLGAILRELKKKKKNGYIVNTNKSVTKALSQNKFLNKFLKDSDSTEYLDEWGTTIPYKELDEKDTNAFDEYIRQLEKHNISNLPDELRKTCMRNLSEIFNNVSEHADSELGVFICGQLYYGRDSLALVVTDLGRGILESVRKSEGGNWTADRAIEWAVKKGKTSKTFGGWGLSRLIDSVDKYGGQLDIVSGNCYWRRAGGHNITGTLMFEFPGTTIIMEINTTIAKLMSSQSWGSG